MTHLNKIIPLILVALFTLDSCKNGSTTSTTNETTNTNSVAGASAGQLALSEAQLENARTNYGTYCAGCHGQELETFADRAWKHGNSGEALVKSITNGHPGEGMPAFGNTLAEEDIRNLAVYIREGIKNVASNKAVEEKKPAHVQRSEEQNFTLDTIITGLESPWGMAFLPDGDMLVTDRSGTFYRLTKNRQLQKIEGSPEVLAEGQGGLLDVELHPNFRQNNFVYLSYSAFKQEGGEKLSTTAIMRAKLEGNKLTNQQNIYEAPLWSKARHHYGCRLEFGKDGYLYFTMGDRGDKDKNPQNLGSPAGKTHRIKDDGGIPADNPFVKKQGALPTIYTYGNRNAQGMALNPETGDMWQHEHGPKGGDELHRLKKGANYGWPVVTYGIDYNGSIISNLTTKEGIENPIYYWVPSIAPSGMTFVSGDRYKAWKGDLLIGAMSFKYLSRIKLDGNKVVKEEKLLQDIGRVRNVQMSPDGYIYIAVERPGIIYRLIPVE